MTDYAEILRLSRKYRARADEPLCETFIRVAQQLEKAKPERCKTCFRTALEYSRLVDATCADAWHAPVSRS